MSPCLSFWISPYMDSSWWHQTQADWRECPQSAFSIEGWKKSNLHRVQAPKIGKMTSTLFLSPEVPFFAELIKAGFHIISFALFPFSLSCFFRLLFRRDRPRIFGLLTFLRFLPFFLQMFCRLSPHFHLFSPLLQPNRTLFHLLPLRSGCSGDVIRWLKQSSPTTEIQTRLHYFVTSIQYLQKWLKVKDLALGFTSAYEH